MNRIANPKMWNFSTTLSKFYRNFTIHRSYFCPSITKFPHPLYTMSKTLSVSPESASSGQSFIIPTYTITRRKDLSLQFNPPVGSRELANALSIKYPFAESLQKQIDHAILDYIASEPLTENPDFLLLDKSFKNLKYKASSLERHSPYPSPPLENFRPATPGSTGKHVEKRRRRSKFDPEKRRKVAGVRKIGACAYHRKKKTEVRSLKPLMTSVSGLHGEVQLHPQSEISRATAELKASPCAKNDSCRLQFLPVSS